MLVTIGTDLPKVVVYFRSDETSAQNESEEKGVGLPPEKKGKQNAGSPSKKCRKEKSMFCPYQEIDKRDTYKCLGEPPTTS